MYEEEAQSVCCGMLSGRWHLRSLAYWHLCVSSVFSPELWGRSIDLLLQNNVAEVTECHCDIHRRKTVASALDPAPQVEQGERSRIVLEGGSIVGSTVFPSPKGTVCDRFGKQCFVLLTQ